MNNSYDNAFYNFRKKVAEGKRKNTLAHSNLISPKELNDRYHEDIIKNRKIFCFVDDDEYQDYIEHAQYGPSSGTNQYVAKIDDAYGKGKPRYFYTREEYDAYLKNKQGASQAGADRANKEKSNADPRNPLEKAQGGREASINKAYTDEQKRRVAEKEKKEKAYAYNKNKNDLIRKNEDYAKNADKDMNSKKSEKATKEKKALEWLNQTAKDNMDYMFKQSNKKQGINSLSEDSYAKQAYDQALAEINNISLDELKEDRQLYRALLMEFDEDPKKAMELSKKMREKYDKIVNDEVKKVKDTLKQVRKFFNPKNHKSGEGSVSISNIDKDGEQVAKEIEEKLSEAMKRSVNKNLNGDYSSHNNTDAYMDFLGSLSKEEKDVLATVYDYYHNNYRPGLLRNAQESREWEEHVGQVKLKQEMNKNSVKHSSVNSNELLNEYFAFKQRVKAGTQKNTLYHSNLISPQELNDRYHADYESECYLVHASGKYGPSSGTNQYVAKIDDAYGKGKPRYFYTREEYDAYLKNKQGASQAGADRGAKESREVNRQRQTSLNNAQSGREAAIKKSDKGIGPDMLTRNQSNRDKEIKDAYLYKDYNDAGYQRGVSRKETIRKNEGYAENAEKEKAAKVKENASKVLKNATDKFKETTKEYSDDFEKWKAESERKLEEAKKKGQAEYNKAKQEYEAEFNKRTKDLKKDYNDALKDTQDYIKDWYDNNKDEIQNYVNDVADMTNDWLKENKDYANSVYNDMYKKAEDLYKSGGKKGGWGGFGF